jgi:hypothetical protein
MTEWDMPYTVINRSKETIRWTVHVDGRPDWTSDDLPPGGQRSEVDTSPGTAVQISFAVPQYDSQGNPHGSIGWGGALVHKDGCVTVFGDWNYDVRPRCGADIAG